MPGDEARTNGPTDEDILRTIEEIEAKDEEIYNEKLLYMSRVEPLREDRAKIVKDAGDRGFDKKALKAKIKQRGLIRAAEGLPKGLDLAGQAAFLHLTQKLGDYGSTPLGEATLKQARAGLAKVLHEDEETIYAPEGQ